MTRSFIKKYYLDNSSTLLLPFFFVTLSLIIFLQQFPFFDIRKMIQEKNSIETSWILLISGVYPALVGMMWGFYKTLKSYINKKVKEEKKKQNMSIILSNYEDDLKNIIPREKQYKKMEEFFNKTFKHKRYAFFVGKSGNGKSLLLSQFKSECEENLTVFSTNNENGKNDYANSIDLEVYIKKIIDAKKNAMDYYYLIFDQFEKALLDWNTFKVIIEELKNKDLRDTNIRFIFACRKDKYADVFGELQNEEIINDQNDTYFLRVEKDEKQYMLEYIKEELKLGEGDKRYKFFGHLLEDLCSGEASMIEVNIAINYFKNAGVAEINEMFKKNPYPLKEIIKSVFEKSFLLTEPDLGMIIIYSLCCENYIYGLTLHDFQNLTFAPKDTVIEILKSLEDLRIIKKVYNFGNEEVPYLMAHDYLVENLKKYCKNNLDEKIILNIDFYCKLKKDMDSKKNEENKKSEENEKNEENEENGEQLKGSLSPYYQKAVEEKIVSVTYCLIFLCTIIFGVCIWQEINGYNAIIEFERDYNTFALTVLAVGSAVFYVYHYLQHFAKIFLIDKGATFWLCLSLIIFGMTFSVLALIMNEFWISWIAAGWLIVAFLHFNLSKKFPSNENIRKRFRGEGVLYVILTFSFIGLNIWFLKYLSSWSDMHPWFGVFILFTFGAIRQHLNTNWILSKIGSFTGLCLFVQEDT